METKDLTKLMIAIESCNTVCKLEIKSLKIKQKLELEILNNNIKEADTLI